MKNAILVLSATLVGLALLPATSGAHCQVPCGIYDDAARIARMYEDAATIEKAMVQMATWPARPTPRAPISSRAGSSPRTCMPRTSSPPWRSIS